MGTLTVWGLYLPLRLPDNGIAGGQNAFWLARQLSEYGRRIVSWDWPFIRPIDYTFWQSVFLLELRQACGAGNRNVLFPLIADTKRKQPFILAAKWQADGPAFFIGEKALALASLKNPAATNHSSNFQFNFPGPDRPAGPHWPRKNSARSATWQALKMR